MQAKWSHFKRKNFHLGYIFNGTLWQFWLVFIFSFRSSWLWKHYSLKSSILTRMCFVIRVLAFQPQLTHLAISSNIAHFFFVPTSRRPVVTVEPFVTKRGTAMHHHELEWHAWKLVCNFPGQGHRADITKVWLSVSIISNVIKHLWYIIIQSALQTH